MLLSSSSLSSAITSLKRFGSLPGMCDVSTMVGGIICCGAEGVGVTAAVWGNPPEAVEAAAVK